MFALYFYLFKLLCSILSPDTSQIGDRALKAAQGTRQNIVQHFVLLLNSCIKILINLTKKSYSECLRVLRTVVLTGRGRRELLFIGE